MKHFNGYFKKICLTLSILLLASCLAALFLNNRLEPVVLASGRAEVRAISADAINEAILEEFAKVKYDDLVSVQKDERGKPVLVQANAAAINGVMAKVCTNAQERIEAQGLQGISVSIGTLIGGIFSDLGYRFKVYFKPVGSISASYKSRFADAGINQTIHTISIETVCKAQLIAGDMTAEEVITVQMPVMENIIVGDVPQTYATKGGWDFSLR